MKFIIVLLISAVAIFAKSSSSHTSSHTSISHSSPSHSMTTTKTVSHSTPVSKPAPVHSTPVVLHSTPSPVSKATSSPVQTKKFELNKTPEPVKKTETKPVNNTVPKVNTVTPVSNTTINSMTNNKNTMNNNRNKFTSRSYYYRSYSPLYGYNNVHSTTAPFSVYIRSIEKNKYQILSDNINLSETTMILKDNKNLPIKISNNLGKYTFRTSSSNVNLDVKYHSKGLSFKFVL